jgi:hypothetical protein
MARVSRIGRVALECHLLGLDNKPLSPGLRLTPAKAHGKAIEAAGRQPADDREWLDSSVSFRESPKCCTDAPTDQQL